MLVSRSPIATYLCLERRVAEAIYCCVHFGLVVILSIEVLGILGFVLQFLPCVRVGGGLYFGDEGGTLSQHLPIGIGVVIVQEKLDISGRNLLPGLVIDQLEWNVVGM